MPSADPPAPGDEAVTGFPPLNEAEDELPTRKLPLEELPRQHQLGACLEVIRQYHPHIAKSIDALWGFAECEQYLNRLAFDGSDPHAHVRMGFRAEVLSALIRLQSLHTVTQR